MYLTKRLRSDGRVAIRLIRRRVWKSFLRGSAYM